MFFTKMLATSHDVVTYAKVGIGEWILWIEKYKQSTNIEFVGLKTFLHPFQKKISRLSNILPN